MGLCRLYRPIPFFPSVSAMEFCWRCWRSISCGGLHLGYHNLVRAREDVVYTRRAAEGLFFFGAFLFIFAYVYASNANMDYVQRYAVGGGTIRFAPDTRTERLLVAGRYLPFLGVDLLIFIAAIRKRHSLASAEGLFAPFLMLLAVGLSVLANPSFLHVEGLGWLGWVSLVPLFVLIRCEVAARRPGRAIWYGVLYGALFTLIGNYWLGTFNLISLQAVGVIFLAFYGIYTPIAVGALMLVTGKWAVVPRCAGRRLHSLVSRLRPLAGALILPLSWSFFEFRQEHRFPRVSVVACRSLPIPRAGDDPARRSRRGLVGELCRSPCERICSGGAFGCGAAGPAFIQVVDSRGVGHRDQRNLRHRAARFRSARSRRVRGSLWFNRTTTPGKTSTARPSIPFDASRMKRSRSTPTSSCGRRPRSYPTSDGGRRKIPDGTILWRWSRISWNILKRSTRGSLPVTTIIDASSTIPGR